MIANEAAQDVISNNLANANTTGFKQDIPQFQSFQESLLQRMSGSSSQVGTLGGGAGVENAATDFSGGALQKTDNPLDLALTGNACLAVRNSSGVYYSRDGALSLNAQGQLTQTNGGALVLDQSNRPITIPAHTKSITITKSGQVLADNTAVGNLQLVAVDKTTQATKIGSNLFTETTVRPASSDSTVEQGYLEASNVNVVKGMVDMIATMRAYETSQKMMQSEDDATGKAVQDVAKVQ